MLLSASSAKMMSVKIKEIMSLIVIFSILLSFVMLLPYVQHSYTVAYAEAEFDFFTSEFVEEQITEIQHLPFIEAVFPVRLLAGEVRSENRKTTVDIHAADHFQNRYITYFSERFNIKQDRGIIENLQLNPIIIDRQIARLLKVGVGDDVAIPFRNDYDVLDVRFTVAAITEPLSTGSLPPVLILWQGEHRQAFVNSFGEDPIYSKMFVKTNDMEQAKSYFVDEYIPLQLVKDGILSLDDQDGIIEANTSMFVEREAYLDDLRWELRYTPPVVVMTSLLGFLTYLLVLYREGNKKLLFHEKDFAILNAIGMPKSYIILFAILEALYVQLPVLIASALIVKYVVYDLLTNSYLPWYFFIWYCIGAFILQIAAVIFNGFLLHVKMKKSSTATQLAKE